MSFHPPARKKTATSCGNPGGLLASHRIYLALGRTEGRVNLQPIEGKAKRGVRSAAAERDDYRPARCFGALLAEVGRLPGALNVHTRTHSNTFLGGACMMCVCFLPMLLLFFHHNFLATAGRPSRPSYAETHNVSLSFSLFLSFSAPVLAKSPPFLFLLHLRGGWAFT